MTLVFTFSKDWVCIKGVEFLRGEDLIDVMSWVSGHNNDEYNVKINRCTDGYRVEVDMDI